MPVPPENVAPVVQSTVIIRSHSHLDWAPLVEGIMESSPLAPSCDEEDLTYSVLYNTPWKIVNKYYTATVHLSVLSHQWPQQLTGIKEQAEAIIIYWDNTQEDCLTKLNEILQQLQCFQPEVCLLVCDGFPTHAKLSRYESTQWCVTNGWELVELQAPEDDADSDDLEDDFEESCSYNRIRGALYANCWTSKSMNYRTGTGSNITAGLHNLTSDSTDPFVGAPAHPSCLLDSDDEDDDLDLPPQQEVDESFDDLFSRFEKLRVTAESLPRNDRLNYAEQVAMAFLESMGEGSEAEEASGDDDHSEGRDDSPGNTSSPLASGSSASSVNEKTTPTKAKEEKKTSTDIKFEQLVDELEYVPTAEFDIEELGFPILKDVEKVTKVTSDKTISPTTETITSKVGELVGAISDDDFCAPSYDAIEQEFAEAEAAKMVTRLKESEEILDEFKEFQDHNKRAK